MLVKLLRGFWRPYSGLLLGVLVLQLSAVLANLYLPTLNGQIIDQGVARGDVGYVWSRGSLMLAVSLLQIACAAGATYCAARAAMGLGRDIRAAVYGRVSGFGEAEIRQFGTGSLITRATNDVQQVQGMAMMGGTTLVVAPLMALGGVVMAIRQDVSLAWIIAVAVPVLLVVAGLVVRQLVPLFRSYQQKLDAVNLTMREQLTGVRVIRAFVRETIEEARFRANNTDIMWVGRRVGSLFVLLMPAVMLVMNIAVVCVIWFGGKGIDSGTLEVGTVIAFMQYVTMILSGVLMATFMAVMVPRAAVSSERIIAVLDAEPTVKQAADAARTFSTPGTLEFVRTTFAYPDAEQPVVSGVSARVERGQTLAIIGSTGSGKSTLVNMIPRLFDPTAGKVLVGGVDAELLALETLWGAIGLVPQKAYLFQGTVASNLTFSKPDATETQMWRALEIAQARDFVQAMPGGLEAEIAQGGTNLSGGQRQRLAIARAILREPDLLIFDDSFTALDLATDARLRAALWRDYPQTTKIVVAQRVSTIAEADQIMVLDHGSVVGLGTHQQLAETCSTYIEIIESQLAAEAL